MKILLQVAVSVVVVTVVGTAVAQDDSGPASQYERVKQFEDFVGMWQGDFQPPGGPEGTVRGFCRMTSNNSFAQFQWMFRPNEAEDEQPMHVATVIMGWDGENQRLTAWSFFPQGHGSGEIEVTDDGLVITAKGVTAEGEETSSTVTYQLDGDSLTVTVTDAMVGGQEMPGYSFTATKRERPGRGGR